MGIIDFCNIKKTDKSAEIGYWLNIDAVGNGYMSEAVKLVET